MTGGVGSGGERAPEACDFLLATRIQYESRRKVVPAPRPHDDGQVPEPVEPDLRAAEFLLATRARTEAARPRSRMAPARGDPSESSTSGLTGR